MQTNCVILYTVNKTNNQQVVSLIDCNPGNPGGDNFETQNNCIFINLNFSCGRHFL